MRATVAAVALLLFGALAARAGSLVEPALPEDWALPSALPAVPPVGGASALGTPSFGSLEGGELLSAVREAEQRSQRPHDYVEAKRYLFGVADHVLQDGVGGVRDAYSQTFVPGSSEDGAAYPERGDVNGDGRVDREGMNLEHVWPQSFFDRRLPMRSDLHNLLPTFEYPNTARGDLPFGEVRGRAEYSNKAGARCDGEVFEPPDAAKGRVARALLYFVVRYGGDGVTDGDFSEDFWDGRIAMVLRWNRAHPPTPEERHRNDLVQRFQGNRNPFVDDPSLADRIGEQVLRLPPSRRR